tara:strand:+ start:377 stop:628 length:252 start_codon:yes stop_codon:yes gene_type:complete
MALLDFFKRKKQPTLPIQEDYIPVEVEQIKHLHIDEQNIDLNNDGIINNKDLIKVEKYLSDLTLPDYKREYYQALKNQIIKNL